MKKINIVFTLFLLGCATAPIDAERISFRKKEQTRKALTIMYYAAEVVAPFILMGAALQANSVKKAKVDTYIYSEHPFAALIGSSALVFIMSESFIHGCRGLKKELTPGVKEIHRTIRNKSATQ